MSYKNQVALSYTRLDIKLYYFQEIQMEKVQSTLLNQIHVVAVGQPIVAWVSKHTSITLIVGK